jgi:hypothetical protein
VKPNQHESASRSRILGVRFGANPNSSSLGVDVTFLLFGGAGIFAATLVLSALLRGRRARATALEKGQP